MTSGEIQQIIKEAMQDAFRRPKDLEQLFQYKLDDNLYNYVGNSGGIIDYVSSVITKFDSQNRLDELVIAAIRMNPTNVKLQKLAASIDIYFPVDNKLSKDFSDLLKTILDNIDFNITKTVLFGTLLEKIKDNTKLDTIKSKFKDVENITNNQSKNCIEFFLIKKLLLVDYQTLERSEVLTVLRFVENLANNPDLNRTNSQILKDLRDWVAKIVTKPDLDHSSSPKSESDGLIRSYLLIIIKREENNKYRINAYLIPNEEDKDNIEPLDIELAEKGFLCPFEQIKNKIPEFLDKAQNFIIDNLLNKNSRVKSLELIIEFFLPTEHLDEQVEHYLLSEGNVKRYIGNEYSVVVRSYERLKKPDYRISLYNASTKLMNIRKKLENQSIQDIRSVLHHLEALDNLNWMSLKDNLLEEKKIGLKISSPLPSASEIQYEALFTAIFVSGTPIVIWKRSCSIAQHLNVNCNDIVNSSNFFRFVLSERQAAYRRMNNIQQCENHLESHLGVLCEEPNLKEYSDLNAAIKNL